GIVVDATGIHHKRPGARQVRPQADRAKKAIFDSPDRDFLTSGELLDVHAAPLPPHQDPLRQFSLCALMDAQPPSLRLDEVRDEMDSGLPAAQEIPHPVSLPPGEPEAEELDTVLSEQSPVEFDVLQDILELAR